MSNIDFQSEEEKLTELISGILVGTEAIPVKLKIMLDTMMGLIDEETLNPILVNSQWSREYYNRGYKKKADTVLQTFAIIDEKEAMDRLSSFAFYSPLIQNAFRYGFIPPIFHVNPMPMLPVQSILPTPSLPNEPSKLSLAKAPIIPKPVVSLKVETEHLNVVDSPSPPDSSRFEEELSRPASHESNINYIMKQKKRVFCGECGKSFCDKGALKIHTSAVHLKEMHMCTIPGCGKEFSSRRSRNRHSSNTNPKLHMPEGPQFRHDLRNPVHNVASTNFLSQSSAFPQRPTVLPSVASSSTLDTRNTVTPDSQVEDTKPNLPILGKRPADFNRTDEKRLSLSEICGTSPAGLSLSSPTPSMLSNLDLQLFFLQQLVQTQTSAQAAYPSVRTTVAQ